MNVQLLSIFHAHLPSIPAFFMVSEFIARTATSPKCGSWDPDTKRTCRFQLLLNQALGSLSHSTASTNRHLIHAKLVSDLTHLQLFEDVSLGGRGIRVEGVRNSRAAAKSTCPYQLPPWLQEELLTSSSQKSKTSSKCQPILESWCYKAKCESLCPPWASARMQEISRLWEHPVPFPTRAYFFIAIMFGSIVLLSLLHPCGVLLQRSVSTYPDIS